jgi:hypothetical protein
MGRLSGDWTRVVFDPSEVQPETSQHQVRDCDLSLPRSVRGVAKPEQRLALISALRNMLRRGGGG